MDASLVMVALFLVISVWLTISMGKLAVWAGIVGGAIGLLLYIGAGLTGLAMLAAFFILGTAATAWKAKEKVIANQLNDSGPRKLGQVFANGGMAGILGLVIFLFPGYDTLFQLGIAASLASATADTLSSELGTLYGRKFYNILTLRKDQCGLDGVVSLEGLCIGILGSALIAAIYCAGFGWSTAFLVIVFSGTAGNLLDSLLGAALERRGLIKNDLVNFLNTFFAATVAILVST